MSFSHLIHVVCYTFFQAACSTLLAILIAFPLAFFCAKRKFFFRKFLLSLSLVPFCLPSLIIALGYVSFLGLNGNLNHFLMTVFGLKNPPVKFLYSFAGLIIAQGFYNFPIIMKSLSDSWEALPSDSSDAAKMLGASNSRIFRTITIYQLLPSLSSSSLLVFIYCFLSFILVLLFGGVGTSTLEVEIFKAARGSLDFSKVALLTITESIFLILITYLYSFVEIKSSQKTKGIKNSLKDQHSSIRGAKEIFIFSLLLFIILLFFIAPLGAIITNAFTSSNIREKGFTFSTFKKVFSMRSFLPSLKTTILLGLGTGFLSTLLGFFYATLLRFAERKFYGRLILFLNVLPMLPMTISSVAAGIIISLIVKRGNLMLLILTQTALFWPLSFRIINPRLEKISSQSLDSVFIYSRNTFDIIKRVIFPVSLPSLINSFGFCFAVSAGDTTLPLVLSIPKLDTLSLFTYRLAGAYRFNEACASGVILGGLCILLYSLTKFFDRD